jgi:hypothetical protein
MESKYYTPELKEFVKGFEYEVKHTYRYGMLDLTDNNNSEFSEPVDIWSKHTLEKDWDENYFFNPFDLNTFIKNKTIRTEIK